MVTLPPDVVEYDIPCDLNQTNDPVMISPDIIKEDKDREETIQDP